MFRKINETRFCLHFSKRKYNVASLDALPFIFLASELINVLVLFSARRM
jgi:hypothetical protein